MEATDPMNYKALINYLEAKHISLALQVVVSGFKGLFENSEDDPVKFAESFHQILEELDEYDAIIKENEPLIHLTARSHSSNSRNTQERLDSLDKYLQEHYGSDGSRIYQTPLSPIRKLNPARTTKSPKRPQFVTSASPQAVPNRYEDFNPNMNSTNFSRHHLGLDRSHKYQYLKDDGEYTKLAYLDIEEDPLIYRRKLHYSPSLRPPVNAPRPRSDSYYQNPFLKKYMGK